MESCTKDSSSGSFNRDPKFDSLTHFLCQERMKGFRSSILRIRWTMYKNPSDDYNVLFGYKNQFSMKSPWIHIRPVTPSPKAKAYADQRRRVTEGFGTDKKVRQNHLMRAPWWMAMDHFVFVCGVDPRHSNISAAYMYTYIHAHRYVYIYILLFIYSYMHKQIFISILYTYIYICVCVCARVWIHSHVFMG